MTIPERYQVRGKCIDAREKTGEWITGYYLFCVSSAGNMHCIVIPAANPEKAIRTLEVDYATVGPVAVQVEKHRCPNCGKVFWQYISSAFGQCVEYCDLCGQRLAWGD